MGLTAVRLVECGFTGEIDGVGNVYSRVLSDVFDPQRMIADMGTEWLIAKNYFKLHPTGRYVHSAIDALEDLLSRVPGTRLDIARIRTIRVRAYMLAAMLAEKHVVSSFGARFSVPFALASILYHGRSGLQSFDDAAVANPHIQALAAKVDIAEDKAYTARFPEEQVCDLAIELDDGTLMEGRCIVTKGEPAKPHSEDELKGKFFDLGAPIWGDDTTDRLYVGLGNMQDIPDFAAFSRALSL
jgi:2-methylcitrate dehydratase PrpD